RARDLHRSQARGSHGRERIRRSGRSLIDGLNHGLAESAKNDRFATLLSLLSAEDQLVAELQRRRGRWVARNGAILFSTPADLAAVRPQFERTRSLQHEFQQEQSQARSDIGAAAEDMRQTAARDLADPHTP
ncbi:MAG: hypothetical protein ACXWKM_14435, partial [Phenylobacterium sp.]